MDGEKLKIVESLARIDSKLDILLKNYNKIVYMLLAIIAASIGIKVLGTPFIVIVSVYCQWLAGIFLLGASVGRWKYITFGQRLVRSSFGLMLTFSATVKTFVFELGVETAPAWFNPIMCGFYALVSIALIITTWDRWR